VFLHFRVLEAKKPKKQKAKNTTWRESANIAIKQKLHKRAAYVLNGTFL
jgi:hypothetical protein